MMIKQSEAQRLIRELERLAKMQEDLQPPTSPADAAAAFRAIAKDLGAALEDSQHNGWTNYETWVYVLWLENEQSTDQACRAAAREAFEEASRENEAPAEKEERTLRALHTLADRFKEEAEEANPCTEPNVWADLTGAALGEIDWRAVAQNFLDDDLVAEVIAEEMSQAEARIGEMDRGELAAALTAHSIQVYDDETDDVLRDAVRANYADGTIGPDELFPDDPEAY